jgi:2-succinyl-6-hydroxy-2,4-cyclohexadiene-1-carboxylate synthase
MPYFSVNKARYYFQMEGRGEPLVLLHGFTGSCESWTGLVPTFASQCLVIRIDLLGHGRTAAPTSAARYGMAQIADDVSALISQVARPPVHLLGYSMGGRLALHLALTRPALFKTSILESASPGLKTEAERQERIEQDTRLALSIEQGGIASFINRWEQLPLFASQASLSPSLRQKLRDQRLRNNATGLANCLRGMGTGAQPSLWSRLTELHMPLLLLAGGLDHKFADLARQMACEAPDVQLHIVPGAGHAIHLENPGAFEQLVLRFISQKLAEQDLYGER